METGHSQRRRGDLRSFRTHFVDGGRGATEPAEAVEEASDFRFPYPEPVS
jgi:hypothetical protein